MIDAAHAGRLEDAQAIDESLVPLYRALTMTTNPIPVKAGLNLLGHDAGGLRLPLVEATIEQVGVVRSALESSASWFRRRPREHGRHPSASSRWAGSARLART